MASPAIDEDKVSRWQKELVRLHVDLLAVHLPCCGSYIVSSSHKFSSSKLYPAAFKLKFKIIPHLFYYFSLINHR